MVKITFACEDGCLIDVDAEIGLTVMESALARGVPGIDADCRGACACATCHVVVDESFRSVVGAQNAIERELLELKGDAQHGSRLSCQIKVTERLSGALFHVTGMG